MSDGNPMLTRDFLCEIVDSQGRHKADYPVRYRIDGLSEVIPTERIGVLVARFLIDPSTDSF
jgi:hypothetical protein